MIVPYAGNGAYCVSNSLQMCLLGATRDQLDVPEPWFLECLTGMPFGASYHQRHLRFWPSAPGFDPEKGGGVAQAIETLGWACETWHASAPEADAGQTGPADEALVRLRDGLRDGPVMIGPLDFGYLSHFRETGRMAGFDHYVVELALDDQDLLLHDPAGLPFARLPVADLPPPCSAPGAAG
jgi:hypothetical protein